MNLRSFDLNLLVVFDALIETRSTRRAGERIGLSQPAVSNALARLRGQLKDELFVRGAEGMQPTPRALELTGPLRQALHEIESALDPPAFDPKVDRRAFWLGANDYTVTTILPQLMARLAAEAPVIDLRVMPSAGRSFDLLDAGQIDLAIAAFDQIPERFESVVLRRDDYVCVMRRDHALADQTRITLRAFAAGTHLLVSPRGDETGFVDKELAKRGLTRRIGLTINNFSAAPAILAQTELIATLPRRVACSFHGADDFLIVDAPIQPVEVFGLPTAIWHRRLGNHPANRWFRSFIIETTRLENDDTR